MIHLYIIFILENILHSSQTFPHTFWTLKPLATEHKRTKSNDFPHSVNPYQTVHISYTKLSPLDRRRLVSFTKETSGFTYLHFTFNGYVSLQLVITHTQKKNSEIKMLSYLFTSQQLKWIKKVNQRQIKLLRLQMLTSV